MNNNTNVENITGSKNPEPAALQEKTTESKRDRIIKWYINPLKFCREDTDVFICLTFSFSLIEKIIRIQLGMNPKDGFRGNKKAMNIVGKMLSVSANDAKAIWNSFRNGLAHKAMIDSVEFDFILDPNAAFSAEVQGKNITINPWKFRDIAVKLIEDNIGNIKSEHVPSEFVTINK